MSGLEERRLEDSLAVESYRSEPQRTLTLCVVDLATLVLGSTQPDAIVDRDAAARLGVGIARRRSGGGAVYVAPDDPLWMNVWIPSNDPLFSADVRRSPMWVGEWWRAALGEDGRSALVHGGAPECSAVSADTCFGGVGPGEVTVDDRKLVGVAQWRCRQGALFHVAAYRRWRSEPLASLFGSNVERNRAMAEDLERRVTDLETVLGADTDGHRVLERLVGALPDDRAWRIEER